LVLEHGWAYGSGGRQLAGKAIFNAITCGAPRETYAPEGRNRFTIPQFLTVFNQTATLCNMLYLPPFVVHGTHRLSTPAIDMFADQYRRILQAFAEGRIGQSQWQHVTYLNDLDLVFENA
jgi:glutathione-regulated potassium-efflux system ancillary protein KefG